MSDDPSKWGAVQVGGPKEWGAVEKPPEPPDDSFLGKLRAGARRELRKKIPTAALKAGELLVPPMTPLNESIIAGGGTGEGALEALPIYGAALGAALGGGVPGGALGAASGEALRQHVRRAVGLPAAPGVVQRHFGSDPDSTAAAAEGMGAEAALTIPSEVLATALTALSNSSHHLGMRFLINLLDPQGKAAKSEAMDLANRMVTEKIAPPLSTRGSQLARAEAAHAAARTAQGAELDALRAQGAVVDTLPAEEKIYSHIPAELAGGGTPSTGTGARSSAENVARDFENATAGNRYVPIDDALHERTRLDASIPRYWESTSVLQPVGEAGAVKNAGDAWRGAINSQYPALGARNDRLSGVIDAENALRAAKEARDNSPVLASTHSWKGLAFSPVRMLLNSGPFASSSSALLRTLAPFFAAVSAASPALVRAEDVYGAPDLMDREAPPPEKKPESQKPTVSEEEFIKRYQK